MKPRGLPRFLFKLGLLSLPLLLLSLFYAVDDPFKVIRPYACYYRSDAPNFVTLNRDYVSLETFLRHQPQEKWDSFIFGNSRSLFIEVKDWSPRIGSERVYHFDATGESLYGMTRKLQLLDRNRVGLSNALLILDVDTLSTVTNSKDHLFIKHPLLSGQSRLDFQLEFFKTFFSAQFLIAYLDVRFSYKFNPARTKGFLLDSCTFDYDLRHNEIRFGSIERLIAQNPDAYYGPRKAVFYDRPPRPAVSAPVIGQPQKTLLLEMARILKRQGTDYRLVINPLYDQKQFNPTDLGYLRNLFGADRVYDFSGVNKITGDYRNYYETSHYRPQVAREMLSVIYPGNR